MADSLQENAARLVELLAARFGGVLPPLPSAIIAAFLQAMPVVRDADESQQQIFADAVALAIADHLLAQRVAETAGFLA